MFSTSVISKVKLLWLEDIEKLIFIMQHMLRKCNYFIAYTWLPMKWSLMSYTSTRINVSATVPYSMIKRSTEKIKRTKDVCTSMYSWDACSFSAHSIKFPVLGCLLFWYKHSLLCWDPIYVLYYGTNFSHGSLLLS